MYRDCTWCHLRMGNCQERFLGSLTLGCKLEWVNISFAFDNFTFENVEMCIKMMNFFVETLQYKYLYGGWSKYH